MNDEQTSKQSSENVTWGPKLFYSSLFLSLVYFWWLAIYPHGVVSTH
jgi:hypothetical protein